MVAATVPLGLMVPASLMWTKLSPQHSLKFAKCILQLDYVKWLLGSDVREMHNTTERALSVVCNMQPIICLDCIKIYGINCSYAICN